NLARCVPIILLFFGVFPPTTLLWTSVVLHEPWDLLFIIAAIYFGTCILLERGTFSRVCLFLISSLLAAFFHKGFMYFYPLFIYISLMIYFFSRKKLHKTFLAVLWTSIAFLILLFTL